MKTPARGRALCGRENGVSLIRLSLVLLVLLILLIVRLGRRRRRGRPAPLDLRSILVRSGRRRRLGRRGAPGRLGPGFASGRRVGRPFAAALGFGLRWRRRRLGRPFAATLNFGLLWRRRRRLLAPLFDVGRRPPLHRSSPRLRG